MFMSKHKCRSQSELRFMFDIGKNVFCITAGELKFADQKKNVNTKLL